MNYIYNDLSKQENIVTNTKYLLIPSTLTGFHKIIWARKPTTLEWWDESRLSFSTLRLYISLNSSGGDFTYATSKITI